MNLRTPAIVLGGTGYVAGELLRLLATHPYFDLAAVASDSQPDEPVAQFFRHLQPVLPHLRFAAHDEIAEYITANPATAIFSAAPHGVSAALIDRLLTTAEQAGTTARVVDISADFRYTSADAYEAVYKHAHGAPARIPEFTCAVPEHLNALHTPHVAHPGCFATAALLASVPLLSLGLVEPRLFLSGVTGSTGAGRQPDRRHASSAAPQRPLCLQPAVASPCTGNHCARTCRLRRAGGFRVRAAFRAIRARDPHDRASRRPRSRSRLTSWCMRCVSTTTSRSSCA